MGIRTPFEGKTDCRVPCAHGSGNDSAFCTAPHVYGAVCSCTGDPGAAMERLGGRAACSFLSISAVRNFFAGNDCRGRGRVGSPKGKAQTAKTGYGAEAGSRPAAVRDRVVHPARTALPNCALYRSESSCASISPRVSFRPQKGHFLRSRRRRIPKEPPSFMRIYTRWKT